jgi:small-conductance mechanosensitive channel
MKYTVEMDSGAMIYIPNFIKIGSAIQNLIRGDSQTDRHADIMVIL